MILVAAPSETVAGLKVIKLLIIEENPAYLELYRLKIESFDLPVALLMASNGYDGLLTAGQQTPRIIVAGLELASLDPFAMIRALDAKLAEAELIVLTQRSDGDIAARGGLPARATVFKHLTQLERLRPVLEDKIRAVRAVR